MKKINLKEMKKGYIEMGEINLLISRDSFHLEEEGEILTYEVATKKTKGATEQ
jgi:hypothetical protein